jgi:hypothetical protein
MEEPVEAAACDKASRRWRDLRLSPGPDKPHVLGHMSTEHLGFLLAIAALVAVGLFFLLYLGLGELRRLEEWETRAVRAEATVIRHEVRSYKGNTYHYPVVRYTTRTGAETVAEVARARRRPDPPVGGGLEVLYDRSAPSAPRLPGQDRAGAIFMGILGGILLAVGVAMAAAVFGR